MKTKPKKGGKEVEDDAEEKPARKSALRKTKPSKPLIQTKTEEKKKEEKVEVEKKNRRRVRKRQRKEKKKKKQRA